MVTGKAPASTPVAGSGASVDAADPVEQPVSPELETDHLVEPFRFARAPATFEGGGRKEDVMARGPEMYRARLQTLRELPTFAGLSDDAIERVAGHVAEITIQPGAHLCRQGSPAMEAFIIVGGIAQLIADGTIVRDIERGELVGEIAVLSGKPRTASVRALTRLEAFVLNAADVKWLVDEPTASGVVRDSVARHLGSDKERHPDPDLLELARERGLALATAAGGMVSRAVRALRS